MLSRMKWSLYNKYTNGNTNSRKKDKYVLWRYFNVGCHLSSNLHMNANDRDILSYILNRNILVITPYSHEDGSSKVKLTIHIPLPRKKARTKHYRIILNKDFSMYYITNSKSMIREYLNIPKLIRKEELIVIQFY